MFGREEDKTQGYWGSHSVVKREPQDIKEEYGEPQDIRSKYGEQLFKVKTEYVEQTFKAEPRDNRVKAESKQKSNGADHVDYKSVLKKKKLESAAVVSIKKEPAAYTETTHKLTWFEKSEIRKWKKIEKRATREREREKLEEEKVEKEKVAASKVGARRAEEAAARARARQHLSNPSFQTVDEVLDEDVAGDMFSWSPPPSL